MAYGHFILGFLRSLSKRIFLPITLSLRGSLVGLIETGPFSFLYLFAVPTLSFLGRFFALALQKNKEKKQRIAKIKSTFERKMNFMGISFKNL